MPQSNHSNRSLCHFCSPPTVPCFAFQVPVALLLFFFTSSVSKVHLFIALFSFFLRLRVPQHQKVSLVLSSAEPRLPLRGTRSTFSCSSWWWRAVARLGASPHGWVWSVGAWPAVACPPGGRPPSRCGPPALPAAGSRAPHWKEKHKWWF